MTPAARIQAAIEILSGIEAATDPADAVTAAYFRKRRYAGSKDRRAITERVYGLLRHQARLRWWIGANSDLEATPRILTLAGLALMDGEGAEAIASLFSGASHAPAALSETEENFIQSVAGQTMDHPDMPIQAVLEIPAWLQESFQARFGGALADEMQALNQPAPVDLRVNTLKGTRKETQASLAGNGIVTEETPFSPLGLRLQGRVKLDATEAYKSGLIEIQDEGSQLAALLSAALAGQTVFDVCAGAGGKTLALAASMNNLGLLIACDTLERRLKRLAPRLRRSGATLIETRVLKEVAEPWMVDDTAVADRVLVDAPCSGSGAWRRHPEARWRLTREDLDGLIASQRTILAGAAKLVKPGGRLIYVTCSLLEEENETQADGFLNAHKDFTCIPAPKVWAETIGGTAPFDGPYALLTPARHGTDGFFIAVFEKVA